MQRMICGLVCAGLAIIGAAQAPAAQATNQTQAATTEVRNGSVSFDVETNVFAVSVHGESKALEGKAKVQETAEGLTLEQIEAVVPVKSLTTGMKLRDDHMRKYIFQTPEGQVPDVRFSAERADCTTAGSVEQSKCVASGVLAIRGTERPFVMELSVAKEGDGFKVQGEGNVKLSAYGIERPSQFGVKTADDVKLRLELTATSAAPALVAGTKR